jgi:putative ABC transport system permease protein
MIWDYFLFSLQSFRARKTRTFLTTLGIFIGIAAVVSLISLSSGLEEAIVGQFSEIGTDILTVQAAETGFGPPGSTAAKKLDEDDFEAVGKARGVKAVAKRYIRTISLEFKDELKFVYSSTLPEKSDVRKLVLDAMNLEIVEGKMLKIGDKYKVIVGNNYYSQNVFPRKIRLRDNILINGQEFEVTGILEKAGNPQLNNVVLLNEEVFEEVLEIEDELDMMIVQIDNPDNMENILEDVEKSLRKSRGVVRGKEDFSIQTPQEAIAALTDILGVIQAVIVGIAGISLIVGGIGIMNTMYTSVIERTREIGIMKSIGAKNSDVLIIFLIESGILGLVGGGIGVALGVGFSKLVEVGARIALGPSILQASFSLFLIVGSLGFAFVIGMISGILPAKQASELQPVEALRK